jgi:dinuclear metal center YbgI/SA1388 family protein
LETTAPLAIQEPYDNTGLLTGTVDDELKGVLITLDTTEEVVEEAVQKNANLIISHHPIIFKGLKKITGNNYVERTVIKAIKNDIAIYAVHTNFDQILNGVNSILCQKLNLKNCKILKPAGDQLRKLVTFVPEGYIEKVQGALFNSGAGHIGNYDCCSYTTQGRGSFRAGEQTNPFVGEKNKIWYENETRIETVFPKYLEADIVHALLSVHPYEEVAFDIYTINNSFSEVGSGMIGEFENETDLKGFLKHAKQILDIGVIKYTGKPDKRIQKVAVCGGSGTFLLTEAIKQKADAFLSSDFKYHEYFEAENKISIIDAGHYETEQFTKELIFDLLIKKFNTFACFLSDINTNPINYI